MGTTFSIPSIAPIPTSAHPANPNNPSIIPISYASNQPIYPSSDPITSTTKHVSSTSVPVHSTSVPFPSISDPLTTTTSTASPNTFADLIGGFLLIEQTPIDLEFNQMQVILKEDCIKLNASNKIKFFFTFSKKIASKFKGINTIMGIDTSTISSIASFSEQ
jgi:hypothetical protein